MTTSIKDQILELRAKGYSYNAIVAELGCSKGTVSYHCGEGQKEKTVLRTRELRSKKPLMAKIYRFRNMRAKGYRISNSDWLSRHPIALLGKRVQEFASRSGRAYDKENPSFTLEEFLDKFGDTKACYLTGREVDFEDAGSYSLDHIVPVSRGGDNSLDNLGVVSPQANMAKRDMDLEEFVQMCLEVVVNFGIVEVVDDEREI